MSEVGGNMPCFDPGYEEAVAKLPPDATFWEILEAASPNEIQEELTDG